MEPLFTETANFRQYSYIFAETPTSLGKEYMASFQRCHRAPVGQY